MPKKSRNTHDYSSQSFDPGMHLSPELAKIESAHSEFRNQAPELRQPRLDIVSSHSCTSLDIKHEEDCLTTCDAFDGVIGPSRPIGHTRHLTWNLNVDSLAPHYSHTRNVQTSSTPSHTTLTAKNTPEQTYNRAHQVHYDDLNSSSIWSTESDSVRLQDWHSQTTGLGTWSGTTSIDPSHWVDTDPVYTISENPNPSFYSEEKYNLAGQFPVPYHHFISPQANENSDLAYHLRRHDMRLSGQLMPAAGTIETTFSEPVNSDLIPYDLHTSYLNSIGTHSVAFDGDLTNTLLPQWSAYKALHDTFTGDSDAKLIAPRPLVSPHGWIMPPIPTTVPNNSEERQLPGEATVQVKSETKDKIIVQPDFAKPPYKRTVVESQKDLDYEQARSGFETPPSLGQPLGPELVWPIYPEHDRELLSVCQSSRQTTCEAANGTSDTKSKPRRPFGEDKRQETSRTRDVGACVRCKMQRVRVSKSISYLIDHA